MEENFIPYLNEVFIDPFVVSNEYFDVCCLFVNCWENENFTDFANLLDDEAEYVQLDRNTFKGKEDIVFYWEDLIKRIKQNHIKIRLSVVQNWYWNRAAIYLIYEDYTNMLVLFGLKNGKIKKIFQSPDIEDRRYGSLFPYFTNHWAPLSSNYIKRTNTRKSISKYDHAPCLNCCLTSKKLKWHHNEMTITYHKIVGIVSMCPNCGQVVEYIPKSIKCIDESNSLFKLAPTQSDFNGDVLFNNTLSEDGIRFHRYIKIAFSDENQEDTDKSDLFNTLDALSLCSGCKLGSQKPGTSDCGGHTTFFIFTDNSNNYDEHIFNHISVEKTIRGAWQAYLLEKSRTFLPVYWHGGYILRRYVFIEDDVRSIPMLENRDMSGLQEILYPSASFVDINRVQVKCCYWNDWKGLVLEIVDVYFDGNRVFFGNEHEYILLPYHCGIFF